MHWGCTIGTCVEDFAALRLREFDRLDLLSGQNMVGVLIQKNISLSVLCFALSGYLSGLCHHATNFLPTKIGSIDEHSKC